MTSRFAPADPLPPPAAPAPAILLVEDEAIVARDLQQTLRELGYDAFAIAASAEEAIARASSAAPDLVLMDIRIKGRSDGIKTAAILKERFHCGVIYLTAHADDATVQRAKKTEPYGYLLKPVKTAELRSTIEIALYRRQLDAAREKTAQLETKLAERALELSSSNSKLKALTDLNLQLASERDARTLLDKVCHGARHMLGTRYAVLVLNEKLTNSLFCTTSGIESAEGAPPLPIPPLEAGPLGRVYAQGAAWRAHSRSHEPQAAVFPAGYPVATSYLAVPISSLTRTYGWLCLADKIGAKEFSLDDERALGILAGQAGRIYENSSLFQDLQLHAAQLRVEIDERELFASNLKRSEERFRQLAENIQDVFFILTADFSEMTYLSPAFDQIWGRPHDPANSMDWTTSIHIEDRQRILDQLASHAGKPAREEFEFRIVQPSGSIRWIFARYFPLYDDQGHPYRIVGIATDITERKQAEARIRHLNRVYGVLSGINGLIVRAQTRAELFTESCRLAVEEGDFRLAWIGRLERGEELVLPLARAGKGGVAEQMLRDGVPVAIEADALQAIRRREPWVCNDLDAGDRKSPYRRQMSAHGLRSVVTLPLGMHGHCVGCMVLATDEREAFDAAEMRLLVELAGDISFALDYLEKAERLNYLAYYDSSTGLANRTLFLERLAQQVSAAKRCGAKFAVVVHDPERFETINETFGRSHGDALLKEIADRLVTCTGDHDYVGRIGPGQFASVLPFPGEADLSARMLEEQYQAWLGTPFKVSGHDVTLTAQTGIAIYPHDGSEAESLLSNAETALRRASSSENRTVFFTKEIGDRISQRFSMETRLRRALKNGEFVLHYQPKVDVGTRAWVGLEALIRWQSPELGLVPPVRFIALMEETGMIVDMGAWVLLQACTDRCAWLEQGLAVPRVAINVSSVQLRRSDFLDVVRGSLKRATRNAAIFGVRGAGIDLEVTESLFVENVESNIANLRAVRELGMEIAIDDFGTGYSSLGYLAKMSVDTLKIDRTFTAAMLDDPGVTTLVSTIITLAHSLKLKVVAEGVESEEQANILRLLRCDQMQGYLVSRPLPFDDITALLSPSPAKSP
jgi:diguanylate cyclase (GGDEF)-like protein/PAS domain S-box-containing protein